VSRDPEVIPVQFYRAGRPAEGISEETKQRALLQSNQ
jgi:hypothetical protein